MPMPVSLMRSLIVALALLPFALVLSPVAIAQRFSVSTIPSPQGGTDEEAYSINQRGAVTGNVTIGSQSCAYIYADGSFTPVCSLIDGQGGTAFSINASNQLAGSSDNHGFIYSHGTVAEVGLLPHGTFSGLLSLNDLGDATGQADTDPDPYKGNVGRSHAILYSFATRKLTDLGTLPTGDQTYGLGINNAGDVTGWGTVTGNGGYDAFLYSSGKLNDIGKQPGWMASQGSAINRYAQVAGYFYGSDSMFHAFLYDNGSAQDLGTDFTPDAMNDFADIVGSGGDAVNPYMSSNAELYSSGVVQDLNTLVPADAPVYLASAVSINNSGQIIGDGIQPDFSFAEYILTPICDRTQYPISDSDLSKNEHWCKAAKGILISPFSAEFGDVPVGRLSRPILVHASNTSGSPIVFQGSEGTAHFNYKTGSCHLKDGRPGLESGETCAVSVTFSPVSPGEDKGQVSLETSDGPIVFYLDGTGTD